MHSCALCPLPRQLAWRDGVFAVHATPWKISALAGRDRALCAKLEALGLEFDSDIGLAGYSIAAGETPADVPPPGKPEAYRLEVTPKGFALAGSDAAGIFWGLVTIEQLIEQVQAIPACSISDWPAISIRGHFDDISRKQISRPDDFRRIIRYLSRYKVNTYCLYIEDVLHLRAYPDIGEGRGKLLPHEVAAIVAEGKLHHVSVMPAFQLFGHYENTLATANYRHLAREVFQSPSSVDPRKPAVREFLANCIREVCELFPSEYFCIGFDETQGIDAKTYLEHANWCGREVAKHGKKPVFWADMLYNHFGCDAIQKMHKSLVPANWNYGAVHEEIAHQQELEAQGRAVWGFGGYNNWGCFMPDFERSKDHIETWAGLLAGRPGSALLCTMWGDDGYENSRDLCWNLYAFLAEQSWSGTSAERASFEGRFQQSFYGAALPGVKQIIAETASALSERPGWYWRMHRKNASSLFRHALAHPQWPEALERDRRLLSRSLVLLGEDRKAVRRETGHLDHFAVALKRMLLVVERLLFAYRHVADRTSDACIAEAQLMAEGVREVRDDYARAWLRHNKRENIEVSLRVFDEAAASYERLVRDETKPLLRKGFQTVDLSAHWNARFLDIAGLPIGEEVLQAVPYAFADVEHTHVELAPPLSLSIALELATVADIHLVASTPKPKDELPACALRVQLLCEGRVVFSEDLLSIAHLVDWWAPLGEHLWAGGGLRHADASRTQYVCKPDHYYGLVAVRAFPLATPVAADTLVLTPCGTTAVQVFAVTLKLGARL